jgi:hypothetical protein
MHRGQQPFHVELGAGDEVSGAAGGHGIDVVLGGRSRREQRGLNLEKTLAVQMSPESTDDSPAQFESGSPGSQIFLLGHEGFRISRVRRSFPCGCRA